jgi:FtsP/CotA-like multicopper oxidase with cupredoxin domain
MYLRSLLQKGVDMIRPIRGAFLGVFFTISVLAAGAETVSVSLTIRPARLELRPGLVAQVWAYNSVVPGTPIVARVGDRVVIDVTNQLLVPTNIHWHGLEVPNDQDGPGFSIPAGAKHRYEFVARQTGTYWYHSHQVPVLDQLDRGLYGPFIVKAAEDAAYSGDHVLILDDWYLDANGRRLEGTARGAMERLGNVESVNGKTGSAIEPLVFRQGELHKLRFINASTAAVHTVRITGHVFRVTHTDGHGLVEPYQIDVLTLSPGERLDAEVAAVGSEGTEYFISSDRPDLGIRIPIKYGPGKVASVSSPYVPPESKAFPGIWDKAPNFVLELGSAMRMGGMGSGSMDGMGGMGNSMGGMGSTDGKESTGNTMTSMMRWTINGASFPDTEPLFVKVGSVVKVRFFNRDTQMMHPMDHAMHLHGTYFQVVSENGAKPPRETWKDTVNVPAGRFVDVAFVMRNPGTWMLHCHIIDHEDNGMMTMVMAE